MIKQPNIKKMEIYLDGPSGNAFVILGEAQRQAHKLGFNFVEIDLEMKQGDYKHLIKTFDKYFGAEIDLITIQKHLLED